MRILNILAIIFVIIFNSIELSSQGNKKSKDSSSQSAFLTPEDYLQSSSSSSPSRYEWDNVRPQLTVVFPAISPMSILLETKDTSTFHSELGGYSDDDPPPKWMTEPFFHEYFNVFLSTGGPGRHFNSKSNLQGPYPRGNPALGHAPNIAYINLGAQGRYHTITKFEYFNVNKEQCNGDYYDKIFVTIPGTQLVYYAWIQVHRPPRT